MKTDKETDKTYLVRCYCENCGSRGFGRFGREEVHVMWVRIPHGTHVHDAECPECGCRELVINGHPRR